MNKVASVFAAPKVILPGDCYGPTNAEDDVDSKLNVGANAVVPHFNLDYSRFIPLRISTKRGFARSRFQLGSTVMKADKSTSRSL